MERVNSLSAALALGALCAAAAAALGTQPPAANAAAGPLSEEPTPEIVIEGRHEGPRMWKVESGNHTLWILGTIAPLPKKMVWEPVSVQEVLRHSQEVVPAWPTYGIGYNPITALRLYIAWRRLQRPPDQLLLKQSLPPVSPDREPPRDLWPVVLRRLCEPAAPLQAIRHNWFDWALLAGLILFAVAFPATIPVFLYYL